MQILIHHDALSNIIVLIIIALAIFCYSILFELCFFSSKNRQWYDHCMHWLNSLSSMLGALPLLGLLGTISGLLQTFFHMSIDHNLNVSELMSSGISDAMLTTQIGLSFVVPGWLMHALLRRRTSMWFVANNQPTLKISYTTKTDTTSEARGNYAKNA